MKNFYYVNQQAQQTIIFVQGGPSPCVFLDKTKHNQENTSRAWVPYMNLVQKLPITYSEYNIAQVFQHQNFTSEAAETLEKGKVFVDKSLLLLKDTIKHFNSLNHKIVLMGHSYGAFLIQQYLVENGNNDVDKIVIGNCRIKTPTIFFDQITIHNKLPFVDDKDNLLSFRTSPPEMHKLIKAMAYMMQFDYTKKLQSLDLSNVMFLSSAPDKWLGSFSQDEVAWVESTNATLLLTKEEDIHGFEQDFCIKLGNTTLAHNSLFYNKFIEQIKNWL